MKESQAVSHHPTVYFSSAIIYELPNLKCQYIFCIVHRIASTHASTHFCWCNFAHYTENSLINHLSLSPFLSLPFTSHFISLQLFPIVTKYAHDQKHVKSEDMEQDIFFLKIHHCKLLYCTEYVRQRTDIVQHYTGNGPAEKKAQYWRKSSVTSEMMAMQPKPALFNCVRFFRFLASAL